MLRRDYVVLRVLALVWVCCVLTLAAPAFAMDKVSVRLNWVPGVEHGFFYLGKDKGWYTKEGIDLDIVAGQGSTVTVKTVGSGENDFGVVDGMTLARAWEQGVPLVATAVVLKETPAVVYAKKTIGITRLSDLCGKRLGINIKSATVAQYRAMISAAKLTCKITEVPAGGNGLAEIMNGTVDAALAFTYEDPVRLEVEHIPVSQIYARNYFHLYSLAIITNKTLLDTKHDLVVRFMRATFKSLNYSVAHPNETLAAFLKATPEADKAYQTARLPVFNKLLTSGGAENVGRFTRKGWDGTIATLVKLGAIEKPIDVSDRILIPPRGEAGR
jgi:NitT/TauT family transport system substrate-binding protein